MLSFFVSNYKISVFLSTSVPGAVFTKGLSQVLGLSWLYFYTKLKPKTWLRPFMNTAPGVLLIQHTKIFYCFQHKDLLYSIQNYPQKKKHNDFITLNLTDS